MSVKPIRHGDVVLTPVKAIPADTETVRRQNGRLILAEGEITGHAHAITADHAELVTADQAAELYLLVHGAAVSLTHEEHHTVQVPPPPAGYSGYRVSVLREYTPEYVRPVYD